MNNVGDQLDATITIYWYSNQLNMFRAIFAHPQERKTVFYSVWCNAPKLLPAGGLERGGTAYVFGVKDVTNQLNMFRAIFCPSSGAQDCFTACGVMQQSCCRPVAWSVEALPMCSV